MLILALAGYLQMEKYKNAKFGRCPRVYCSGQPCLAVGQSDIPRQSTVNIIVQSAKIYMPLNPGLKLVSFDFSLLRPNIWRYLNMHVNDNF